MATSSPRSAGAIPSWAVYAQLILIRAVGSRDFLPTAESRLRRAVARAYEIEEPAQERIEEIAESWRPFRSWVAFLLRVSLQDER